MRAVLYHAHATGIRITHQTDAPVAPPVPWVAHMNSNIIQIHRAAIAMADISNTMAAVQNAHPMPHARKHRLPVTRDIIRLRPPDVGPARPPAAAPLPQHRRPVPHLPHNVIFPRVLNSQMAPATERTPAILIIAVKKIPAFAGLFFISR